MKHGIAPSVLAAQVQATAGWALDGPLTAASIVRDAARIELAWKEDPAGLDYFRLLLAAHTLTVATFCPTDVDARIRHHFWSDIETPERLAEAVDVVDEAAAVDPRSVSARVLVCSAPASGERERERTLSGHDGEWFSVRAGALGRALALGADAIVERVQAAVEDELAREAAEFEARVRADDVVGALSAATILAHNSGDLSRVVEAWPRTTDARTNEVRARYVRLGHEPDRSRYGGAFYVAGIVNKKVMAIENHRFLALRKPRALRQSRSLLLPIGPFFDAWGRHVAQSLDERDRAEVLDALLETHLRGPDQLGVLRAIAGMIDAGVGPWDRVVGHLPARLRKVVVSGPVQSVVRTPERAFAARIENRYRAALAEGLKA